jgi:hypothetical protein
MNPNLEIDLVRILDEAGRNPFKWGWNDCNTLALQWLDKLQDRGWLDRVRGTYSNLREAKKIASELPQWSEGLLAEGWTEISQQEASVGDLAVVSDRFYDRVHIVMGAYMVSMHESEGMVKIPLDSVEARYFRIL